MRDLIWVAAAAAFVFAGMAIYGDRRYKAGVRHTTADFVTRDIQGAQDVRTIAEEALRRIGDDPDVDELLRATGGLRPD